MDYHVGYCTNVHAGATIDEAAANLREHAAAVKARVSPDSPLGVGLWLSESALAGGGERFFADIFTDHGLIPYTFNAFPMLDFHQDVVKHEVYKPTWAETRRSQYTARLIGRMDSLLPPGVAGTLSTLPLAWGHPELTGRQLFGSARALADMAELLHELEEETGRHIRLCLEPEPGCVLDTAPDVIDFFENRLFTSYDEELIRRYLGVCHDVCHSAVMFEPQHEAIAAYRAAGITVGKVQVSSAVRMPQWTPEARDQLARFHEPKFLHQTCVRQEAGADAVFYEDLDQALNSGTESGEWRVHFHVPVYLEQFGDLHTTRGEILECLDALGPDADDIHFEIETYAWGVLPEELRVPTLADGIARELEWFRSVRDRPSVDE